MGELTNKLKGAANEAVGSAKVAVGETYDRPGMVASGKAQKGKAQKILGSIEGALGDKF